MNWAKHRQGAFIRAFFANGKACIAQGIFKS
jgi:hypothetical protein